MVPWVRCSICLYGFLIFTFFLTFKSWYLSKFQLKRLIGWVFLQVGMKCETKIHVISYSPGLEVIKVEYSLSLKIKHIDWLLVDTCPQAANHCTLFMIEVKVIALDAVPAAFYEHQMCPVCKEILQRR